MNWLPTNEPSGYIVPRDQATLRKQAVEFGNWLDGQTRRVDAVGLLASIVAGKNDATRELRKANGGRQINTLAEMDEALRRLGCRTRFIDLVRIASAEARGLW